ncbi:hypothetical protein D9758_013660 [Tetrapyrgos nigripes]|uniref:Endonuclease/exonuclease/phosphatase domain-containing protein n=1 Tax=Tetrapyrgos nigripes TaxID=182062 RepID=A0A8H5FQZ7_9AGAR|nr:hypothetical protein D9758_013660 [Tetrapyrgos nigripes]
MEEQLMETWGMHTYDENYERNMNSINNFIDQIETAIRIRATRPVPTPTPPASMTQPEVHLPRQTRRTVVRIGKKTKASIKVASLNIRGYGPNENLDDTENKWNYIKQFIRQKQIGVQEAHMDEDRRCEVEEKFSRRLVRQSSADPDRPRGKGGVAIVLNKQLVDATVLEKKEIIPGRALLIRIRWDNSRQLKILVVYAPNVSRSNGTENAQFWNTLRKFFERNPTKKPNIMAGDINMVEAGMIDRLPA